MEIVVVADDFGASKTASLIVWLPRVQISAQITASFRQFQGLSPTWFVSPSISRYLQDSDQFLMTQSTTIDHISHCRMVEFGFEVYVKPDVVNPRVDASALAEAVATATIFIES